jgi:heme exporter protein D
MNWSEFFSMGGYAFYVWGSYLVALIVMGGEVVSLLRRRKSLRRQRSTSSKTGGSILTNETPS